MARKTKYLSAALAAVAVVATVAVARTIHSHAVSTERATVGSGVMSAAPEPTMPGELHGIVACGFATGLDCDQVEQLLPE